MKPDAEILVPPQAHNMKCRTFLAEHFPGLAPATLAGLFKGGKVRVNGRKAGPDQEVMPGDAVTLPRPTAVQAARLAAPIPLDILFENPVCLVLNKPPGLVVEPGPGHKHGTLREALLAHYGDTLRALGPKHDYGLVHRLDRDTSGALLVAKTGEAHDMLVKQFAERTIQKIYLALVSGEMPMGARILLRDPLQKVRRNDRSRMRPARRGVQAETMVRPLERFMNGRYSLVEASPLTGRTHQIRVHLARHGHPVIGDPEYGDPMANAQASRQLGIRRVILHARSLRFIDPLTGHPILVEAEPPRDLSALLHRLEQDGSP